MGRATARARMDVPDALNVPLFRQLTEQLEDSGRHVILDLGGASTPMLALLGRSRCRVEIAHLASDGGIDLMNAGETTEARVMTAASLLPAYRPDDAIDRVFCWDLANYLKPEAMTALMAAIAERARPGALAHALIVYSERSMPDRPGRYIPTEDSRLVDRAKSATQIAAPRYSPEVLGRIMGRFVIDRARLLANGMQEFLFRLEE